MYKVIQGSVPIPEDITPQCVLDALVAQGLNPVKKDYNYTCRRSALMTVSAGGRGAPGHFFYPTFIASILSSSCCSMSRCRQCCNASN